MQSVEIVERVEELALAKMSIGSERVEKRPNLLTQMLFARKVVQVLNSSLVLLLHDGSRSLSKDLQLIDDLLVYIKSTSSFQSITSAIVIT